MRAQHRCFNFTWRLHVRKPRPSSEMHCTYNNRTEQLKPHFVKQKTIQQFRTKIEYSCCASSDDNTGKAVQLLQRESYWRFSDCEAHRRCKEQYAWERPVCVCAVSYTHLDVYKRQTLCGANFDNAHYWVLTRVNICDYPAFPLKGSALSSRMRTSCPTVKFLEVVRHLLRCCNWCR